MKILYVSDLHFHQPWYTWLQHEAPDHDLLAIGGDLLDQNHPVPVDQQIEWVSQWIRNWARPLCICRGNHDRVWNAKDGQWQPPVWLDALAGPMTWTRPGLIRFHALEILIHDYRKSVPRTTADLWITHLPPSPSAVSRSIDGTDDGDEKLFQRLQEEGPSLLLCGHEHTPTDWRAKVGRTLCFNAGMGAHAAAPNHILIDTAEGSANWVCGDARGTEKFTLRDRVANVVP